MATVDGRLTIRVQQADFDATSEVAALSRDRGAVGAVVTFTGYCRDEAGSLAALELEHYPGMAEGEIGRIAAEASERWPLLGLTVIHRFGRLLPGEQIVLVAAAAAHRSAAFSAADFMMDYLKTSAPFWKKEHRRDGSVGDWVAAKESDDLAQARWR